MLHVVLLQAKASLEKTRQSLEAENVDMANDLKQLSVGRQEAERRRKQAEQQLQDYTIRLAETERSRGDLGDKSNKLQVSFL